MSHPHHEMTLHKGIWLLGRMPLGAIFDLTGSCGVYIHEKNASCTFRSVSVATKHRTRADRRVTIESAQADAIADAAADEIRRSGVRGANLERIAADAGVSRSTLYRRFPKKEDLLGAVVERLRRGYARQVVMSTAGKNPRDAVVETFVIGVLGIRTDDLVRKIVADTPDALGMFVGFDTAQVEDLVEAFSQGIAANLRSAGASMPEEDLRHAAELVFRMLTSLALTPTRALDIDDAESVRSYAAKFIAPMIW